MANQCRLSNSIPSIQKLGRGWELPVKQVAASSIAQNNTILTPTSGLVCMGQKRRCLGECIILLALRTEPDPRANSAQGTV